MNLYVENNTLHTLCSIIFAPFRASTKTFLTLVLLAAVAFFTGAAQAASYTNNASGNWDVDGSWLNGASGGRPVAGGNSDAIIVFQNSSSANWNSTNNNAGVFVLNGLRVMVPTAKGVSLYPSGGSSLLFTNSSGGILPTIMGGAQVLNVYSPITLATNLTISHATPGGTIRLYGGIDGTGDITLQGTSAITLAGIINSSGSIINSGSSPVTISGDIGNNVTTVVQNSATTSLILSGLNTFMGGVQLAAGTLNINSATALGTGPFTISGGTTNDCTAAADVTMTANNAQNWNGDFTFTGTKSLNLGSGAVAMSASRQVTVSAKTLTVGGSISGIGFGLTKLGAGTLVLSGVNTYSGGTVINAGTVTVMRAASLPGYATPGKVTVSGGILIESIGAAGSWSQSQIEALRVANGVTPGIDISNGNFDYTATSDVTFASITRGTAGTLRLIQDQANRVSVTSDLSGLNVTNILPWAIIKTGSTVDLAVGGEAGLPITAYASYTTDGTTWGAAINARPANSVTVTAGTTMNSLVLDDTKNFTHTTAGIATIKMIVQTGGSSTITPRNNTGALAIGGSVIDVEGTLIIAGCGTASLIGGTLTKTGPGTLKLGSDNSFSSLQMSNGGNFYINQGLVEYSVQNGGTANQVWGNNTLYFNGGDLTVHAQNGKSDGNGSANRSLAFNANATFTLDNDSTTLAAGITNSLGTYASAAHSVTFNPVTVTIAGGAHVSSGSAGLILGTTNTAIHTVSLNGTPTLNVVNPTAGGTTELTLNGVIGDGGLGYGITKTGNGMLTLSGANTYTGTSVVNVGTLRITQASCLSTNSSVSIAAGAIMDLDFSGINTVKSLTLGTSPMSPGVYGVGNKGASYFSGNGALNVTTGPSSSNGTIIQFF